MCVGNHCETRTLMKSVLFMGSLRDLSLYPSSTSDTLICMCSEAEGQGKLCKRDRRSSARYGCR